MPRPYFSVILPTKNRAGLISYAISSLLNQEFEDWELILVDNDDSTATAEYYYSGLLRFLDNRFRYVRTGGLPMADNWEAGLARVRGDYVYVLEDKAVLWPWMLRSVRQTIEEHGADCIIFDAAFQAPPERIDPRRADRLPVLHFPPPGSGMRKTPLSSRSVIEAFARQGWPVLAAHAPRSINSVCSKTLIDKIRSKAANRFYHQLQCDVTAGLLMLDLEEQIVKIESPLVTFGYHPTTSAGALGKTGLDKAFGGMHDLSVDGLELLEAMPLGHMAVLHNFCFCDLKSMQRYAQYNLKEVKVRADDYFTLVLGDLDELQQNGVDVSTLRQGLLRVRTDYREQFI